MILLKLIIGYIFILYLFNLVTKKYVNPYQLYLIFGKKRSGKSTYLTKLAYKYLKRGWNVYTNMEDLMVPGVRFFNIQHLGDFVPEAHSLLLIDEVGMIWDNRDFKAFRPEVRDFFKLQGHLKVIVYLASQTFDVDKKIRDLTDGMFLQTKLLRVFSIGRRIRRTVTLTESTSEAESRICENLKWAPFWQWTFTFIPHWAKRFNSFAIPDKPKLTYTVVPEPESVITDDNPRRFLSRLRKLK